MKELENLLKKEARERAKIKADKALNNPTSTIWLNKNKLSSNQQGKQNLFQLLKEIREQLVDYFFNEEYKKVQEEFYKKVNKHIE